MTHRPFDNAIGHRVIGVSPYANFLARHLNASGGGAEVGGTRGRSLACKQSCAAPPSGTRGRAPARHAGGMVLTRRDPGGPGRDEGRGESEAPRGCCGWRSSAPAGALWQSTNGNRSFPKVAGSRHRRLSGCWTRFAACLVHRSCYRALVGDATISERSAS
jgi:hypothetical protein